MKVVDRDDPKKNWGSEKDHNQSKPVYAGESCGDMVSWKLAGTDSWTNVTFTWTAEGPGGETITGPTGAGKNEWTINDDDEDTATNWLKWKPGKWKIKVQIGSTQAEFEQEVGVRTEQYFVVGTIPDETPSTTGILQRIVDQWACPNTIGALLRVPGGGVNNPAGGHFIPFDEANRVYVVHRLLSSTRNLDPVSALKANEELSAACGLDRYKHYRFFAACQFRFRVEDDKLASSPEFVKGPSGAPVREDMVGSTPFPCMASNSGGGPKGEKHLDSGKVTGPDGSSSAKADDAEFSFVIKNRVGAAGQSGWKVITGRDMPWVFFRFRFEAKGTD